MTTATRAPEDFGSDMIDFHHFPRTALVAKPFLGRDAALRRPPVSAHEYPRTTQRAVPTIRNGAHYNKRMPPRGDAIVLIGFMGAGKSSVGRTLARMAGLPRFDTDEMVAARFGLTISEIFETHGEEKFRDAETEVLRNLADKRGAVITTGGGIVLRPENVFQLRKLGSIVHLWADEKTLFQRVDRRRTRPLLRTENPRATMNELLRVRLPHYRQAADVEIDTSVLTHDEVAKKILTSLEKL